MLTDYDIKQHVASDIGTNQKYLNPDYLQTQENLNQIARWTDANLMKLHEKKKTSYMIFTRSKESFATRFTLNEKVLDRKENLKILGMWLQEDGGWQRNTKELCKNAFTRVSMLTKLKYAGVPTEDLLQIYKTFIRSRLEYNGVVFHSSISNQQEQMLERCQSVCLKIILQEMYVSYEAALEISGLETLKSRREVRCLDFAQKCIRHPSNQRLFPLNDNTLHNVRTREKYLVNFAHTTTYQRSAIPFCQRLLNKKDIERGVQLGEEQEGEQEVVEEVEEVEEVE